MKADSGKKETLADSVEVQGQVGLRLGVAKLCGYKSRVTEYGFTQWQPAGRTDWLTEYGSYSPLPDYPNDLNACAEFEKGLADADKNLYIIHLSSEIGLAGNIAGIIGSSVTAFKFATATAEQRCRAFVKTMGAPSVHSRNEAVEPSGSPKQASPAPPTKGTNQ